MPVMALKRSKFSPEHAFPNELIAWSVTVKILFAAIVYTGDAHREGVQCQHIDQPGWPIRAGTKPGFVRSFSDLIVIVEQGDHPITKPDVGFLLHQYGIPE